MGRPKSPYGYELSRYNRLTNGVMLHELLPSRGPDRCPLSVGCFVVEDPRLAHLCVPAQPCPLESEFYDAYVASGKEHFARCLGWMTPERREEILQELAILSLRRVRLSRFVADEGLLRDKRHPVSGVVYGREIGIGIGRYMTAISRRFFPLMDELIHSPEERLENERREKANDGWPEPDPVEKEPTVKPTRPPEPEKQYDPEWGPPSEWFKLKKPWDHEPGCPPE